MATIYTPPSELRPFKFGLFDCFGDTGVCILGTFVPCLLFKSNAEALAEHPLFTMCCLCEASTWLLRQKLRMAHNLEGDLMSECWQVTCFNPCATCQLAREIQAIQQGGK